VGGGEKIKLKKYILMKNGESDNGKY